MPESILRLGTQVRVINPEHSLYNQLGRYLGVSEVQGLSHLHRICFEGKVQLLPVADFTEATLGSH